MPTVSAVPERFWSGGFPLAGYSGGEVLDVGAGRLRHAQPVEGEQGDQRVRGGRVVEELLLDGVPVAPGDGAQPPGDGRAGPALGL